MTSWICGSGDIIATSRRRSLTRSDDWSKSRFADSHHGKHIGVPVLAG
jgi:hypothetical protein